MPKLEVVAATFATMLLAELGDKTQLLSFALAVRGGFATTFLATSLGFILANLLTAPIGLILRGCLETCLVKVAVGVLFIAAGVLTLLRGGEREQTSKGCSFARSLCLMFLAELGDKTNLTSIALTASTGALFEVALGIVAAAFSLMAVAAALGSLLSKRLPLTLVRKVVGLTFVAVGAATILAPLLGS